MTLDSPPPPRVSSASHPTQPPINSKKLSIGPASLPRPRPELAPDELPFAFAPLRLRLPLKPRPSHLRLDFVDFDFGPTQLPRLAARGFGYLVCGGRDARPGHSQRGSPVRGVPCSGMGPQAAAGRMILLVALMLSVEAGSGAVASTEDPEPPSGNLSELLRAGAGSQAGGARLGSPCGPAAPPWARQPRVLEPRGRRGLRSLHATFASLPTQHKSGLFYS